MSLDNIVGQLLGNGMAGQSRSRLEHLLGPRGLGGAGSGGLGQVLGGLLGGSGGATGGGGFGGSADMGGFGNRMGAGGQVDASGSGGGSGGIGGLGELASRAGGFLGGRQAGGMTGGQFGGLGALAGALLGGGGGAARGALGGSAMAVLGAMALNALQNRGRTAAAADDTTAAPVSEADLQSMVTPQVQALLVRAMISAAKADGQIDQSELDRIMGKVGADGVTDEERREIADELARPLDLQGLVAAVPDEKVAAQVYGASLLSMDADTEAEKEYLRQLAQGLGLDPTVVRRLHELSNAPLV